MKESPTVFQVVMIIINLGGVIIFALIGFLVKNFLIQYRDDKTVTTNRLNSQSSKIDETRSELTTVQLSLAKLNGDIHLNTQRDEARLDLLKEYMRNTQDGINDIKKRQEIETNEIKTIDRRFTDYIINQKK